MLYAMLYCIVLYLQCVLEEDRNISSYCLLLLANGAVDICEAEGEKGGSDSQEKVKTNLK